MDAPCCVENLHEGNKMICELCGAELVPTDTRYIPALDRPDLEIKGTPFNESDYACCGECFMMWEAI